MLVFSREPIPWSFSGDTQEPKTVWWIRPLSDKEWAIIQAQLERQKRIAIETGRGEDDAQAIGRGKDLEHRAIAAAVVRIENYGPEGTITDPSRIVEIVDTMGMPHYQELGAAILKTACVGVLEGN